MSGFTEGGVQKVCTYTNRDSGVVKSDAIVFVTSREPVSELAAAIFARENEWPDHGLHSVSVIGDALVPATIAHAVYAGRKFAEELDRESRDSSTVPFKRELAQFQD